MSERELWFDPSAMLRGMRATKMFWLDISCELIDNSCDADARNIFITVRTIGNSFVISDAGNGCNDLYRMQSFYVSGERGPASRSGKFGIGGLQAQLVAAGQHGRSEVQSITKDKHYYMLCDWGKMMRDGNLKPVYRESPRRKDSKCGTTIKILNGKQFLRRKDDRKKYLLDLSYRYSLAIREGLSITVDIDGEVTKIQPYEIPPSVDEKHLVIEHDGHRVEFHAWLLSSGQPNPHPGISGFFGHRLMRTFPELCDGKCPKLVYGYFCLPKGWDNINVFKSDFVDEPTELLEKLLDASREFFEISHVESTEIHLNAGAKIAGDMLSKAFANPNRRVKGSRPGDAGEEGTIEPTRKGNPHRKFTTSQPGDKADATGPKLSMMPEKVEVIWVPEFHVPIDVDVTGVRKKSFMVQLNASDPALAQYRPIENAGLLAVLCLLKISYKLHDIPAMHEPPLVGMRGLDPMETFSNLLKRLVSPEAKDEAA